MTELKLINQGNRDASLCNSANLREMPAARKASLSWVEEKSHPHLLSLQSFAPGRDILLMFFIS